MALVRVTWHDHEFTEVPHGEGILGCKCGQFKRWVEDDIGDGWLGDVSDEELAAYDLKLSFILARQQGLLGPDGKPIS